MSRHIVRVPKVSRLVLRSLIDGLLLGTWCHTLDPTFLPATLVLVIVRYRLIPGSSRS